MVFGGFIKCLASTSHSAVTQLEANDMKIKIMEERLDKYEKIIQELCCQNAELLKEISGKIEAEGKLERSTVSEAKEFSTSRAILDELI